MKLNNNLTKSCSNFIRYFFTGRRFFSSDFQLIFVLLICPLIISFSTPNSNDIANTRSCARAKTAPSVYLPSRFLPLRPTSDNCPVPCLFLQPASLRLQNPHRTAGWVVKWRVIGMRNACLWAALSAGSAPKTTCQPNDKGAVSLRTRSYCVRLRAGSPAFSLVGLPALRSLPVNALPFFCRSAALHSVTKEEHCHPLHLCALPGRSAARHSTPPTAHGGATCPAATFRIRLRESNDRLTVDLDIVRYVCSGQASPRMPSVALPQHRLRPGTQTIMRTSENCS